MYVYAPFVFITKGVGLGAEGGQEVPGGHERAGNRSSKVP